MCVVLYNHEIVQVCVFFQVPVLPWLFRSACVFVKSPKAGHGACLSKSAGVSDTFFIGFSTVALKKQVQ